MQVGQLAPAWRVYEGREQVVAICSILWTPQNRYCLCVSEHL